MFAAIGIVVLLVMVFGGFILAGGAMGPVLAALPLEFMMIGGAATGATLIGNSMHEIKLLGAGLGRVFKGPKYTDEDHIDAMLASGLGNRRNRHYQTGAVGDEQHHAAIGLGLKQHGPESAFTGFVEVGAGFV